MKNPLTRLFLAVLRFVAMCFLFVIITIKEAWFMLLVIGVLTAITANWVYKTVGVPLLWYELLAVSMAWTFLISAGRRR